MCLMAIGRSKEVRHPLLKKLKSIKALIRFVQVSGDRQWSSRVGALLFHVTRVCCLGQCKTMTREASNDL